jgi:hypothetical protein
MITSTRLCAAALLAAVATPWFVPAATAGIAGQSGIYCSQRSGLMFQLSRVSLGRKRDPQTGVTPATPELSPNQLGLSRYFPTRRERTPPVTLTRSSAPIPYAGVTDIYRSADGVLEVALSESGRADVSVYQDRFAIGGDQPAEDGTAPMLPLEALQFSMPGYVPVLLPYALPPEYRTGTLYDEWEPCFEGRVPGQVSEARKERIYWSYEPQSPRLRASASVYPITNSEAGGDDVYANFINDSGDKKTSRVYRLSRPGDQSYSTARNETSAIFNEGCTYTEYCAVEVMEQDSGLRGGDDLIGRVVLTKSQRGQSYYRLNTESPAEYVLSVTVEAEAEEGQSIFAMREDFDFGDITVYNFDTDHRGPLYALATHTTIIDTDLQDPLIQTEVNTFKIPYLGKYRWRYERDNARGHYQTGGFVLVFRSENDRDAVADRIERIETGKVWTSLTLQAVAAASSLGGPVAQLGQLLRVVDDKVTAALTDLVEDTIGSGSPVATTPTANPFLMVTATDYPNLTGEFPVSVRALEAADTNFDMPVTLYCEAVKHPLDYVCPAAR